MRATRIAWWMWLPLLAVALPVGADDAPAKKPRMVSVMPGVVGQTQAEALRELKNANVAVRVVREASSQVGRVLSQRPAAGTLLEPGTPTYIYVGVAGDVPTVVPRLVGRDIDEVRQRYTAIYVLEIVVLPEQPERRKGIVLAQHPEPGTKHPYRGRVRVEVIPRPTVVPDVVGRNERLARALIEAAGYKPQVTIEERPGVPPGSVLSQDPAPVTQAPRGAIVRLVVSGGSAPVSPRPATPAVKRRSVVCPDLTGLSFDDAHHFARAVGLVPDGWFRRVEDGPSLRVLDQDHVAGSRIPEGTTVKLTVGRRAQPPRDLPVPLLLGYGREGAQRILEGLGYRPRFVPRPSALPRGTVIEQLPRSGRPAAQGSDLVLYVATAAPDGVNAPPVKLPDFSRRSLHDAFAFLSRMNLAAQLRAVPTPGTPMHVVVNQEPRPGTLVAVGGTVTLHVPECVRVPNVVGLAPAQAQVQLRAAGLRSAPVEGPGPYVILRQKPLADQVVSRGTAMQLQVTTPASQPSALVVVPDLRGRNLAQAQKLLDAAGLVLRSVDVRDSVAIGSQDPEPGQRVAPGSAVTVRVGP